MRYPCLHISPGFLDVKCSLADSLHRGAASNKLIQTSLPHGPIANVLCLQQLSCIFFFHLYELTAMSSRSLPSAKYYHGRLNYALGLVPDSKQGGFFEYCRLLFLSSLYYEWPVQDLVISTAWQRVRDHALRPTGGTLLCGADVHHPHAPRQASRSYDIYTLRIDVSCSAVINGLGMDVQSRS